MKNIVILTFLGLFLSLTLPSYAQDYFKERRYEGLEISRTKIRSYYATIGNKKYEIVNKKDESFLGQKLSFDKKTRLFYVKRAKKAMRFSETIAFMKHVGNNQGADDLSKSRNMRIGSFGLMGAGGFVIVATGLPPLLGSTYGEGVTLRNTLPVGIGILMVGGGYYLNIKAQDKLKKTIRYHNKKVGQFSTPVVTKNDFMPSGLGFKSVRTNLLNPNPTPTLSLSWSL
ncbi:hypothetical protein [Bernardetia sp.]|uniref:hypothetical protein n=1 Tax=Bernardetia sp. TaxID=1937974 RepID=UPI0025C6199D|nr:hypothetical protein [Bernardetia sp.]